VSLVFESTATAGVTKPGRSHFPTHFWRAPKVIWQETAEARDGGDAAGSRLSSSHFHLVRCGQLQERPAGDAGPFLLMQSRTLSF
jgi:hypothetical protein